MSKKEWHAVYTVPLGHRWPDVCVCCGGSVEVYVDQTVILSSSTYLGGYSVSYIKTKIPFCHVCKDKGWWQRNRDHNCFGTRAVKLKGSAPSFDAFFRNAEIAGLFREINGILQACPKCGANEYTCGLEIFDQSRHGMRRNTCKNCEHVWWSGYLADLSQLLGKE